MRAPAPRDRSTSTPASATGQRIRRGFPDGLAPLRDYAHTLGLNFGLWVEPERVNLSLVGAPGVEESWLATAGGQYGSDHSGQICLANAAARHWLMDQLTTLLDEVQPDYLKWDNNMFVNCDRDGHGHGATDGNFAHTSRSTTCWRQLRERYPDLLIENVSGGGNRLDIGMLRFTDAAWMDDRTAPSVHVRHNLQGLSAVFPPAYLLSFVTDHDSEPLHDAPDLSLYFRSRMSGALGLCFRADSFTEGETASMSREVEIYKATRHDAERRRRGVADAASGGRRRAAVGRAAGKHRPRTISVILNACSPTAERRPSTSSRPAWTPRRCITCSRWIPERSAIATGAALMSDGIDVRGSPNSAAHILIITARQ